MSPYASTYLYNDNILHFFNEIFKLFIIHKAKKDFTNDKETRNKEEGKLGQIFSHPPDDIRRKSSGWIMGFAPRMVYV